MNYRSRKKNTALKKASKIPTAIDVTDLEFLQYGDNVLIAEEMKSQHKTKTHPNYVSAVCKGRHRNDKILKKALELALRRKAEFPKQVLKS